MRLFVRASALHGKDIVDFRLIEAHHHFAAVKYGHGYSRLSRNVYKLVVIFPRLGYVDNVIAYFSAVKVRFQLCAVSAAVILVSSRFYFLLIIYFSAFSAATAPSETAVTICL